MLLQTLLQQQLQSAMREVTILIDKELEYAKQSHLKSKEIKTLRDRYLILSILPFPHYTSEISKIVILKHVPPIFDLQSYLAILTSSFLSLSWCSSDILSWEHSITRVELLQKQQSTSLDRFRQQAKELKVTVGRDLEEASEDSAGMFFTVLYYAVLCTTVLYCMILFWIMITYWSLMNCIRLHIIFYCFSWLQAHLLSSS